MSRLPPPVEYISATLPKRGNKAEENEDAVAAAPDSLRFAVSDGASEGWESGAWATRLGSAFLRSPPAPPEFSQWLTEVRENWTPPPLAVSAPWYASMKQEQGSFATLIGLELRRSNDSGWAWKAVAVGDSCLLHIRGEELKTAFPLTSPKAFSNRPVLIASSATEPCPEPEWFAGRADPGDLFLLASDAVAARLLDPSALARGLAAVRESLQSRDVATLLDWCREVQTKINDDVSLIAIRLPTTQESP
jgi:serine/threonine protein phosphatase PrpC